jgi:hypothetical protein
MLMLLESKCLVGQDTYQKAISQVIDKYFRDFQNHENDFVPAFLINDILRMWRTFCVNYEFYRKDGDSREKIKNLKLKFSRMLTCYSGIIYLLATFARNKTVTKADVTSMVAFSPTERLETISKTDFWGDSGLPDGIEKIVYGALSLYSDFLELTHQEVKKAVRIYTNDEATWREKSYSFGKNLSNLIDLLGQKSDDAARLRRLITI